MAAVAAHFGRDVERTLTKLSGIVQQARERGVDLLVLPDATIGGYLGDLRHPGGTGVDLPPAIALDGPELAAVVSLAGGMPNIADLPLNVVGDAMREIHKRDAPYLRDSGVDASATFIVGGQIAGAQTPRVARLRCDPDGLARPAGDLGERLQGDRVEFIGPAVVGGHALWQQRRAQSPSATIAVTSPASAPTPELTPKPSASGRATIPTVSPASRSPRHVRRAPA